VSEKENVARKAIWPTNKNILVRVVFLYVGQGSSAVVFAADGDDYFVLLVDINVDKEAGGIDVPRMMKDLLAGGNLAWFINTHPHDDHLEAVEDLSDAVTIKKVAHSGHVPGKKYEDSYKKLQRVIAKVKKAGGKELVLEGSNTPLSMGDAYCHVLAPAEHVTDDVNEDDAEARYRRIHEQCAVLKFGKDKAWIMIPGDADRCAFEDHIAEYHGDNLAAYVLAASHHGSRTFFMENEDDKPYMDALQKINPTYVVVSAPKQNESKHDHPHDEAMELYEEYVGAENVLHLGADRKCYFFDIYKDGKVSGPQDDGSALAKKYGYKDGDDDGGGSKASGGFTPRTQESVIGGPRRFA
jgi:beta-lactamase superfamily II metal-dependent hydrolase